MQLTPACRLTTSHLTRLRALQAKAAVFNRDYPHHADWFERALDEIDRGIRQAYGVFDGEDLVASVILKRVPYIDALELKNLISDPSLNLESDAFEVVLFKRLIRESESVARRHGLRQLIIELPSTWQKHIKLVVDEGFCFLSVRDAHPRSHLQYYVFRKPIAICFIGDPLDFPAMCFWFVREYFAVMAEHFFNLDPSRPGVLDKPRSDTSTSENVCYAAVFDLYPSSLAIVPNLDGRPPLRGACVIAPNRLEQTVLKPTLIALRKTNVALRLLFYPVYREEAQELTTICRAHAVSLLCRTEIESVVGCKPPFRIDETAIAGVVLTLTPPYKEQIRRIGSAFTWIVLTGLGGALNNTCHTDEGALALLVERRALPAKEGFVVCGYANVHEVTRHDLKTVRDHEDAIVSADAPLLLTPDDRRFFMNSFAVTFSDDHEVRLLELREVVLLRDDRPDAQPWLHDIDPQLFQGFEDLLHNAGGWGGVYLSSDQRDAFESFLESGPPFGQENRSGPMLDLRRDDKVSDDMEHRMQHSPRLFPSADLIECVLNAAQELRRVDAVMGAGTLSSFLQHEPTTTPAKSDPSVADLLSIHGIDMFMQDLRQQNIAIIAARDIETTVRSDLRDAVDVLKSCLDGRKHLNLVASQKGIETSLDFYNSDQDNRRKMDAAARRVHATLRQIPVRTAPVEGHEHFNTGS
jgi:hypothetical protein